MERGDRFAAGKEAARRVVSLAVSNGLPVLLGIWWSDELVPLCMGREECIEAVEEYAVIGGRGCWDYALLEAVRLAIPPVYAVLIGCCRGACSRFWTLPSVYRVVVALCVAGYSERSARRMMERGVTLVTSELGELLRVLTWRGVA